MVFVTFFLIQYFCFFSFLGILHSCDHFTSCFDLLSFIRHYMQFLYLSNDISYLFMCALAEHHRDPHSGHLPASLALGSLCLCCWTPRRSLHKLHVARQGTLYLRVVWSSREIRQLQKNKSLTVWSACLQRFGPPDQPYYYKKSDEDQSDDPERSPPRKSIGKGNLLLLLLLLHECNRTSVFLQHEI